MRYEIQVRVYYEDTDFSGLVYHASYLRFMERARTEWLRARAFQNSDLADSLGLKFVVRKLELEFFAPARMDDLLRVTAQLKSVRGAVLEFEQAVNLADKISLPWKNRNCHAAGGKAGAPPALSFGPM